MLRWDDTGDTDGERILHKFSCNASPAIFEFD